MARPIGGAVVPFIVLIVTFALSMLVTARRGPRADVTLSLRIAVAAMFLVSGSSHFVGMRDELVRMVPDVLPVPELIITVTGVLELAGAAAMGSRRLAPWSAAGLALLLVAMFPANLGLALSGVDLPWSKTLAPRSVMQVGFLAATVTLAVRGFAGLRRSPASPEWAAEAPSFV